MPIDAAFRAERERIRIERKASSVVFTKPQVTAANGTVTAETVLAAQTIRINSDNRASVIGGDAGLNPKRAVTIYGIAGVNDIDEGYTFLIGLDLYRVVQIIPGTPGVIQAQAASAS